MSRTRIVKGIYDKITHGDHSMYSKENINSFAGVEVKEKGEEGGISYGDPKDPPARPSNYFIDGYWASDPNGKNKITEAKLGDAVYFIVKTTKAVELPDNNILVQIYDYDYTLGMDVANPDDYIELVDSSGKTDEYVGAYFDAKKNEGKAVQGFRLGDNLSKLMQEGFGWLIKEGTLELYVQVGYREERGVVLPRSKGDYLKVGYPDMDGEIILVNASPNHLLPQMYDALTGDPWYITVYDNYSYLTSDLGDYLGLDDNTDYAAAAANKTSYNLAVRRLESGKIIFNDGTTGKTKRLYDYTVSDIDNTFSKEIKMGANRGNFKKGVTSKGINQLEAMSNRGIAKYFKFAAEYIDLFDKIVDLSYMAVAVTNGEKAELPLMPPFITSESLKQQKDLDEDMYNIFLYQLYDSFDGKISSTEDFLNQWNLNNTNTRWLYDWFVVRTSTNTIQRILSKDLTLIKDIDEVRDVNSTGGLLMYANKEKNKYDLKAIRLYIHIIYLPEIVL